MSDKERAEARALDKKAIQLDREFSRRDPQYSVDLKSEEVKRVLEARQAASNAWHKLGGREYTCPDCDLLMLPTLGTQPRRIEYFRCRKCGERIATRCSLHDEPLELRGGKNSLAGENILACPVESCFVTMSCSEQQFTMAAAEGDKRKAESDMLTELEEFLAKAKSESDRIQKELSRCTFCCGSGSIRQGSPSGSLLGSAEVMEPCPHCGGFGKLW